jgi:hypothetical protein
MRCRKCDFDNDADALFCEQCGKDLSIPDQAGKKYKIPLYILMALVVASVIAVGYYKFFPPSGVAAVVNGEDIPLGEVDAIAQSAIAGVELPPEALSRARYQVLNDLITERIASQEAKKAGLRVSGQEMDDAYAQLVQAAGGDQSAFDAQVKAQYGNMRTFRRSLERRIVIKKYIDQKIAAGIADPRVAGAQVNQWLRDITSQASVRIALAEQLPGSGAACGSGGCGQGASRSCGAGGQGCGSAPKTGADASPQARQAKAAALAYWKARYGDEQVDAKVLDYGCHIQVDMLKGKKIAKSLVFQNGEISEL